MVCGRGVVVGCQFFVFGIRGIRVGFCVIWYSTDGRFFHKNSAKIRRLQETVVLSIESLVGCGESSNHSAMLLLTSLLVIGDENVVYDAHNLQNVRMLSTVDIIVCI